MYIFPIEILTHILKKYVIECFKNGNTKELYKLKSINKQHNQVTSYIIRQHIIQNFIKPVIMSKVARIRLRNAGHNYKLLKNVNYFIDDIQLPGLSAHYVDRSIRRLYSDYYVKEISQKYNLTKEPGYATHKIQICNDIDSFITNFIIIGKNILNISMYIDHECVASISYINASCISFEPFRNGLYLKSLPFSYTYLCIKSTMLHKVYYTSYTLEDTVSLILLRARVYYNDIKIINSWKKLKYIIEDGCGYFRNTSSIEI